MKSTYIDFESDNGKQASRWVLLTRNNVILAGDIFANAATELPEGTPTTRWTDNFASVVSLLRWSAKVDLDKQPVEQDAKD